MPTKVQAKATASSSSTVSAVGNLTGTPVANNVLIATVALGGSASFGITPPSGWAAVDGPSPMNPGGTATAALYWKKAGASEPTSWTWTATGGTPSCNSVTVSEWTGADNTTAPQKVAANISSSPFNTPTLTPSVDQCAILQCVAACNNLASAATGFGFPAACTADDSTGTSTGLGIVVATGHAHDTANQTTATITTARSCTSTGITPSGGVAWTVALHPAPAVGLGTATLRSVAQPINAPYVHPVQSQAHVDSTGSTTAIVGTLDAAPLPGSKLLAFITASNGAMTLTPPAGWSQRNRTADNGGNGCSFLFEKTAGASEGSAWTWTASVAPSDYVVVVVEVTGASTTAAVVGVSITTGTSASTVSPIVTTTFDGSLILQSCAINIATNPPPLPSNPPGSVQDAAGQTANGGLVYNTSLVVTHDSTDQLAAGPTTPRTFTFGVFADTISYTVAVAPNVVTLRTAAAHAVAHGFRPTLKKWVAARNLFKAGTGTPVIVCLGDSITEGFYAGPNARDIDMWVTRLGKGIADAAGNPARAARYMPADVGPHDISNTHGVWPENSTVSSPGTTSPWTGTAAIGNNTFGLGARCLRCTSAVTISLPGGGGGCPSWATHATLCYSADGAGATFTVRSNGVVVDTFTTTGVVVGGVREVPITGGTTYAVDMPSGSYLEGVKWRDKAHGSSWVEVLDSGHGGYQASQYDNSAVLQWAASIAAHNPVLCLVEVGGNDIQAGRTSSQFQANLANMLTEVDNACVANGNSNGKPDYLIVAIPFQGDGTTITVAQWNAYLTAMQNVAAALGTDRCAFLDTQQAGILPASNGIPDQYRDDGIHPNIAGATAYADGFTGYLMGISEGTIATAFGSGPAVATAQPVTLASTFAVRPNASHATLSAHSLLVSGATPPPPPPPAVNGCTVDGVSTNVLSWSAPGDLSGFARYDIQRLNTVTGLWEEVSTILDPAATIWVDREPRIGVEESYRARVVNTSGLPSGWTDVAVGTVDNAGCGYQFSSNQIDEALSLAYADNYQGGFGARLYTFDEGSQVVERTFYDRPDIVAFRSTQTRGARFSRDLLVDTHPVFTGILPAQPLLDLARLDLPYVCVRDEAGSRFYANIRVRTQANKRTPEADFATVTVEVVSVAETPTAEVVLVAVPVGP